MQAQSYRTLFEEEALSTYKLFAFELDDVIFPKKDFLLQVYYLFSNFVEFSALDPKASDLLDDLKNTYLDEGEENLFDNACGKYPSIEPYRENFERLHHQAQLPLKLLVFPELMNKLKQIEKIRVPIVILTAGDPMMQLNKIRQVDWQGLEKYLQVYFVDELKFAGEDPQAYLATTYNISPSEILYVR